MAFMLGLTIMLGVLGTRSVWAHDWYDAQCCAEKDCYPVPDNVVVDAADGGVDVEGFGHLDRDNSKLRMSLDMHDHICEHNVYSDGKSTRALVCVYHVRRGY